MSAKNPLTDTGLGVEYLDAQQVRTRYGGRSEMWLWRMAEKEPSFPRPIKVGARNFWSLCELIKWEETKSREANNADAA